MTEIQRLLTETIESLNTREKRDNKPRFSISFIRKHPGLFIGMYVAFFATLAVMLQSETLSGSVWLLVILWDPVTSFLPIIETVHTSSPALRSRSTGVSASISSHPSARNT